MLTNYGGEYPYKMTELYDAMELHGTNYSLWINDNLLDCFFPYRDFKQVLAVPDNQDGLRIEYLLTKRTTEELALLSRTKKGKMLRNWLLDLKDKVEANELITMEQVYFLIDLVNAFSFVVNQKAIEEAHKQKYINSYLDERGRFSLQHICSQFHIYRNESLNISPEIIQERMLRYVDDDNRLIGSGSKRNILAIIDKYALIGNAAFDFMSFISRSHSVSIDVSEKVKGMAKHMNVQMKQTNTDDLFSKEISLSPVIMGQVEPFIKDKSLREEIKKKLL